MDKYDNVITFYGDYSGYQKVLRKNTNFAHVFLLDQKGIIRWEGYGYASPETEKGLIEVAKASHIANMIINFEQDGGGK